MKISKLLFSLLGILFAFVLCVFVWYGISVSAVSSGDGVIERVEVPVGSTMKSVGRTLEAKKLIRSAYAFYVYARLSKSNLKAGTYRLSSSMSVAEISDELESGKQLYVAVSIPEGLTITKIAHILESQGIVKASDFVLTTKDRAILEKYDIENDRVEGFLFPDTYFFVEDMSPKLVIESMIDNFFKKVSAVPFLAGKSASEINSEVVLASIIEREYRIPNEAFLISSVFHNRLSYNIGLYSCATVEYIITEIQGREHPGVITTVGKDAHTKIDSPYNTYLYAGLPPAPISNPGLLSLRAACEPADTDYFYFRLIDASTGEHVFSHDFEEHKKAGVISQ